MADVSIQALKAEAESLGLTGSDIGHYVISRQNAAREERAKDRDLSRLKFEAEAREYQLLAEREAREHQLLADREAREFELAKLRAETELAQARGTNSEQSPALHFADPVARPKLPTYTDGEDIASYFIRFERVAELLNVSRDTYAVRLGSLLTGKPVEIYTSLSSEVTKDYDLLKQALLRGFNKTPDAYRSDFKRAKIRVGENFQQFSIHLGRLLDYWLKSCDVPEQYQSLREFFLLDQFISSLSAEARMFLKEHKVSTLEEAVQLTDQWTTAHAAYPKHDLQAVKSKRYSSQTAPSKNTTSQATPSTEQDKQRPSPVKCHNCGEKGHIRPRCPQNPAAFKFGGSGSSSSPVEKVGFCFSDSTSRKFSTSGSINGARVSTIIRDTGCSCVLVSEETLPDYDVSNCEKVSVADYLGRIDTFPRVRCYIRCPYFEGWTDALRAPIKFCSILIGNVTGARNPDDSNLENENHCPDVPPDQNSPRLVQAVETRAAKVKRMHPLVLPKLPSHTLSSEEFAGLQSSCPSLETVRRDAASGTKTFSRDGSEFLFQYLDGLLYKVCCASKHKDRIGKHSLVIPSQCRDTVLSVAHESPLAGHFSHRKTEKKIRDHFFWPGMGTDIRNFCRSCDRCQRMSAKGKVRPVPLKPMPILSEPFSRVAIDIVGAISPPSSEGHKYILTLIDMATGFPEALPLKNIDSISVAEALLVIFSRVGIPKEVLSDRGTQFTSQLMGELHKLLGVKPLFTTPFHPAGNGRIERLHATLKSSLRKLCADKPREWHRYLVPTMFALRELPSDRTGFSPFELLYGRAVRGPLSVLKDLWEDKDLSGDNRSSFQYVIELKDKLADCAQLASQNADLSITRYKTYFDLKSQDRTFQPGDEVLVLLPDSSSKLLMAWSGPFTVLERRNKVNYLIEDGGKQKLYHANLLKRYHRRAHVQNANIIDETSPLEELVSEDLNVVNMCILEEDTEADAENHFPITPDGRTDETSPLQNSPVVSPDLSLEQQNDLSSLTKMYEDVFSEIPGCTSALEHDIKLVTTERLKTKLYPIPIHLQPYFNEEVDRLLDQGIIQPSSSPHCSPVVMVRKPDGSYRMAVDYRSLNSITIFDAEPIGTIEEDLHKFSGARYFSELDLTKAYYQVPVSLQSRPLTAFPSHRGLMEFTRLPFGLVTACATYIRLMRIVLAGLSNVSFYFDNVFIFSLTWTDHLDALHAVLQRLREYGLTARPSKCKFAFKSIQYLGFLVDGDTLRPLNDRIQALQDIALPRTKKDLRSFLGMISFYRMFIPQASSHTGPLSDLLRKGSSEPLIWSGSLQNHFNTLKTALLSPPVLKLPDASLTFVLRTDASGTGLGAVLLQYHEDVPYPVSYASRKLLDREKKYSTIERECLAIIFGVQRFDYYLRGKEFILEVDHKPLIFLAKSKTNNRVLRWSLSLQSYRYRLVHVAGKDNVGADFLSRSCK